MCPPFLMTASIRESMLCESRLDRQTKLIYSPSKINHNINKTISTGDCEVTNISGLLVQWFPTAGPHKFFAGPQNIFFPHFIPMLFFFQYKAYIMFFRFLVSETGVFLLSCRHSSKMSAQVTVIVRKKKN